MRGRLSVVAATLILLSAPRAAAVTVHVPGDEPSIQAGISAASAGDTVLVARGTYYEHDVAMKSGVRLTSETGEPDCVVIDALQQGRVLYCEDVDNTTWLGGLTFANGLATGQPPDDEGGGVYCISSSPALVRCVFEGNRAEHSKGGTERSSGCGGGLSCLDGSSPTLTECVFRGNSAQQEGAGIFCGYGDSSPVLEGCRFENNQSDGSAGAFWCWGGAPTLSNCLFTDNLATGGDGGAVLLSLDCGATLIDCTFHGNEASFGGAIFLGPGSDPTIERCLFDANEARHSGGAVASMGISYAQSSPEFVYCTFVENTAVCVGSALFAECSVPVLTNSILAFGGPNPGAAYCSGIGNCTVGFSLSCCDLYGNAGGDWWGCIVDQYGVNGNFSEDPLFCDPGDGDFMIDEVSPCAPNNNTCGVLIGALGIGCGPSAVEPTSWGKIKAQYLRNPMEPPNQGLQPTAGWAFSRPDPD